MRRGDAIYGELDSSDATTAVAFTLYDASNLTARTLASDEFIEIDAIWFSGVNACAAIEVFMGADGTTGAGETVVKSPAPAASTPHLLTPMGFNDSPRGGAAGHSAYLIAGGAGQVDAGFTGRIVKL